MLGDGVVGLTLDEPAKLSVEGVNPKDGLIQIARAIEEPPLPEGHPNLIYFGPGVHRQG